MNAFEGMVGDLEYPMFIVTARAGDEPLGCLVGFTTQASIDPPRFVACLSHNNRTYRLGRDATALGVHAVPADAEDLAELFGGETGDQTDKFARCDWHEGPEGVPVARPLRELVRRPRPGALGCGRSRRVPARAARRLLRRRGRIYVPPRQEDQSGTRGLTLTVSWLTRALIADEGGVGSPSDEGSLAPRQSR